MCERPGIANAIYSKVRPLLEDARNVGHRGPLKKIPVGESILIVSNSVIPNAVRVMVRGSRTVLEVNGEGDSVETGKTSVSSRLEPASEETLRQISTLLDRLG